MKFTPILSLAALAALAALSLASSPSMAMAEDWIEHVQVTQVPGDAGRIDVRATSHGYATSTTDRYDLRLNLYARAKSGRRIKLMRVGTVDTHVFEHDLHWHQDYAFSGQDRTVQFQPVLRAPLAKLLWRGGNPAQRCATLLQEKMARGEAKASVLAQTHHTTATLDLGISAVVLHKSNRDKMPDPRKANPPYDEESDGGHYTIDVRCLAAPGPGGTVQAPGAGRPAAVGLKIPAKVKLLRSRPRR